MKKLILYVMLISPCLMAQIGIKAGLNFANVTNASDINSSSETGFHGGIFLAPASKNILVPGQSSFFHGRDMTIVPIPIPAMSTWIILCCRSSWHSTLPNFSRCSSVSKWHT